jgi:prepilin-type N-terminal cleavage/methylation domain-containing protein
MRNRTMILKHRKHRSQGFTLMELLVVMAVIAMLAALTVGVFGYAQKSAALNRTRTSLAAIQAALEGYKEKHGEYPMARSPELSGEASGGSYRVGSALMLYQAITGDGSDYIDLPGGGRSSDGTIDKEELPDSVNGSLPKSMILRTASGYMLIDGFGRPFQYSRASESDTVNPTYDLWSFGTVERSNDPSVRYDLGSKRNPDVNGKWVKNW